MSAALAPSFGAFSALIALVAGLAFLLAATVVSRQDGAPFSAALAYLAFGGALAAAFAAAGVDWLDPVAEPAALQYLLEAAIVIALFATGLRIDRPLGWGRWRAVVRLLLVAMPLTIAGVALLGSLLLELSLAVAIVVGAMLSPTDPVLAGEIGVGGPGNEGEDEEREERFAISGEAGLNDGLALVAVTFGLTLAGERGRGLAGWLAFDVGYSLAAALAVGVAIGSGAGWIAIRSHERGRLPPMLDPFVGIGTAFVLFGAAESIAANGFIAVFVGALAFRRFERHDELTDGVFTGLVRGERIGELAAIVLLGTMLSLDGLASIGWAGWALALALAVVVRPLSVLVAFSTGGWTWSERLFLAWFGVRGLATLYYAAALLAAGLLAQRVAETIWWTAVATVIVSVVLHGVTGSLGVALAARGRARETLRAASVTSGSHR